MASLELPSSKVSAIVFGAEQVVMMVPAAGPARALRGREIESSTGAAQPRGMRNTKILSGIYILIKRFKI